MYVCIKFDVLEALQVIEVSSEKNNNRHLFCFEAVKTENIAVLYLLGIPNRRLRDIFIIKFLKSYIHMYVQSYLEDVGRWLKFGRWRSVCYS